MAKPHFLVASLLLLLAAAEPRKASAADPGKKDVLGGYEPIQNISSPYIQSLGEYAVDEHNKQANTHLKFQRVISGFFQIVAGTNYRLRLTAIDGTVSRTYGTVVYKDLNFFNHLTDFYGISN